MPLSWIFQGLTWFRLYIKILILKLFGLLIKLSWYLAFAVIYDIVLWKNYSIGMVKIHFSIGCTLRDYTYNDVGNKLKIILSLWYEHQSTTPPLRHGKLVLHSYIFFIISYPPLLSFHCCYIIHAANTSASSGSGGSRKKESNDPKAKKWQ